MASHTVGLHIILVADENFLLPVKLYPAVEKCIERIAKKRGVGFFASNVQPDHVHVLLSVNDELSLTRVVDAVITDLQDLFAAHAEVGAGFRWDSGVHVTLLPPWHLEIMASFVRDQDRFHEFKSLEEELDEVFRPNSAMDEQRAHESVLDIN